MHITEGQSRSGDSVAKSHVAFKSNCLLVQRTMEFLNHSAVTKLIKIASPFFPFAIF